MPESGTGLITLLRKNARLVRVVILIALVADVTYGAATYNTAYGCGLGFNFQTIPSPEQTGGKVLTEPCFYIYYYGILGGSALLIFSLPNPVQKKNS